MPRLAGTLSPKGLEVYGLILAVSNQFVNEMFYGELASTQPLARGL
jgi:hypothetical protein